MVTIASQTITTTEVSRSKFITFLVPISEYKGLQAKLKSEHSKANHVVYALRYLNEYEQIVENSSDDGEPKGCAGVPALNVLRGEELINCAVLIVRYFGGIKLGTGGMARAYAQAVKNVIAESSLVSYVKEGTFTFSTSYSDVNKTLYQLMQLTLSKYERDFGIEKVEWKVTGSEESIEKFKQERGL
ncbi:YigZ family protein [Sulfurovum sp.]|uniref:IMPACT family protein n=1 Tax=Sulfurovum sp. TaxID=1969726 RepID=UPI002867EA74|nr:YigZ family protein [Sulfurovum sp.]